MSKGKKQKEQRKKRYEKAIAKVFDPAASNKSEYKTPLYDSGIDNLSGKVQFIDTIPDLKVIQILDVRKPNRNSKKNGSLGYADFI